MIDYFVHEKALCESGNIGLRTRIWANVHILEGARIGHDCNICDNVFIENDVVVGNRVTIKCGVQLWDGVRLEDDVFVGPNATFTNDPFPRSREYRKQPCITVVHKGVSIGANATVLPGIEIGPHAMVGAGAVVTKNVPPHAIVYGNPACIQGYTDPAGKTLQGVVTLSNEDIESGNLPLELDVSGCTLLRFPKFSDLRGDLCVYDYNADLPFVPKRQFIVSGVSNSKVRGEHAHRECEQLLIAVHGSLNVILSDGKKTCEVILNSPAIGLYMPAGIWGTQYKFSKDVVLSVHASLSYDPEEYIRTYDEFIAFRNPG